MTLNVAVLGGPAERVSVLSGLVTESVDFEAVPDISDREAVTDALQRAQVVVGRWPAEAGAAPNLQMIQHPAAGMDAVDFEALPTGVYVCNVYEHGRSIAEHVIMLILALKRQLIEFDAGLRAGRWPDPPPMGYFDELNAMTLGIVGFGHIGSALVEPARAFGMEIRAVRREPSRHPVPDGVRSVEGPEQLRSMLRACDVAVVAVPHSEDTTGMIGRPELGELGNDGLLVNVARGPIVEEKALYEALRDGEIAGAGIDTWYNYPDDRDNECQPSNFPFGELDNVVLTPHVSGWSRQTARYRQVFIASNIDRIARGERPRNVVWHRR